MVEKLTKEDVLAKLIKAHKENPCFNDKVDDVNWAAIGSFPNFESLLDFIKIPECYRKSLVRVNEEIFSLVHVDRETCQKDINIFFYKYLYTLMYTDPSQDIHKEIKQQLFEYFSNISKNDKEEGLGNTFKLVKLIVFFCCSMFSLTMYTLFGDAFNKKLTEGIIKEKSKDCDESVDSCDDEDFEELITGIEKTLTNTFPDYHSMRVFIKIIVKVLGSLGVKFSTALEKFEEKDFNQIMSLIENDNDLLCLDSSEDKLNDSNSSYEDPKLINKWFTTIPELTKEEVEFANKAFMNLNFPDIIFTSCVDFSYEKTMETFDF